MLVFVIHFLNMLFQLMYWCLILSVLLSWFAAGRSPLGMAIEQIVRPILAPFRWARIGMIDFSPIVAFIALGFAQEYLIRFLVQYVA